MITIKDQILAVLNNITFTQVNKIADGISNEDILEDMEKTVFTNSAILLGDLDIQSTRQSHAYNIDKYTCTMWLVWKTNTARQAVETNLTLLINNLTDNDMGISGILTSNIINTGIVEEYNDRIKYRKIILEIKATQLIAETKAQASFRYITFVRRNGSETIVAIGEV